jgi:hypothetical protein
MGCRGRVGALILLMLSARPVMADLAPGQGPTYSKGRARTVVGTPPGGASA